MWRVSAKGTLLVKYTCKMIDMSAWIFSLGFTTLFGALFSKTYRVYVIFRDYQIRRKHIRDAHLLAILAGLVLVDVLVLLPWSVFHPMTKLERIHGKQVVLELNTIITEISEFCHHEYQAYYLAAVYVYKGLLLAFGTFLAWETRKVNVPELNDSKQIGACIYNVVVVCIFGVPLAHVLRIGQSMLVFVLLSSLVIFCTTVCQCIIFVPKVKFINNVSPRFVTGFAERNVASCSTSRNLDLNIKLPAELPEDCRDIAEVKLQNRHLRMQIAQESIAIARLRHGLRQMSGNIYFYRSGSQYILCKTDSALCTDTPSLREDIYTG